VSTPAPRVRHGRGVQMYCVDAGVLTASTNVQLSNRVVGRDESIAVEGSGLRRHHPGRAPLRGVTSGLSVLRVQSRLRFGVDVAIVGACPGSGGTSRGHPCDPRLGTVGNWVSS
jgi:hypothetical protein